MIMIRGRFLFALISRMMETIKRIANRIAFSERQKNVVGKHLARRDGEICNRREIGARAVFPVAVAKTVAGDLIRHGHERADAEVICIDIRRPMFRDAPAFIWPAGLGSLQ